MTFVGDVAWLTDREQRAWRALVGATSALMATLDAELQAAHQMSLADYEVLVALSEAPDRRLRMSDLAAVLHLSPSGLTRRLDGLTRRSWVTRERCPSDRRGTFAVLVDEGYRRLEEAAPTHVAGVRRHFIDRLSDRQLSNLAGALDGLEAATCASAAELLPGMSKDDYDDAPAEANGNAAKVR
jgi:DNA-binding MarR family transcriptional regulator